MDSRRPGREAPGGGQTSSARPGCIPRAAGGDQARWRGGQWLTRCSARSMQPIPSGGDVVDGQPVDAADMTAASTVAQSVFQDDETRSFTADGRTTYVDRGLPSAGDWSVTGDGTFASFWTPTCRGRTRLGGLSRTECGWAPVSRIPAAASGARAGIDDWTRFEPSVEITIGSVLPPVRLLDSWLRRTLTSAV